MRAVRFLIAVTGSQLGDVPEHVIGRRLAIVATSMAMVDVGWSMVTGGATGVDQVATKWAAEHDVEHRAVEAVGLFAGPQRNRLLLDLMRSAFDQGWAARLECFPTDASASAWELVKLCKGNGFPYTVTM